MPIPASPSSRIVLPRPVERQSSICRAEVPEFLDPANERGGSVTRHRPRLETGRTLNRVHMDRTRMAAQHDLPAVGDPDSVARGEHGRFVDEDLALGGDRLQPRRGHDRRTRQAVLLERARAGQRGHLAGRDANAHLERLVAAALRQRRTDRQSAQRGTDRIVIPRHRPAEYREDRVADELLARSPEPLHLLSHGRKGVGDAGLDELGIMLGDHPDVVDDVREQRGDNSAIPLGRDGRADSTPGADRASAASGEPH